MRLHTLFGVLAAAVCDISKRNLKHFSFTGIVYELKNNPAQFDGDEEGVNSALFEQFHF